MILYDKFKIYSNEGGGLKEKVDIWPQTKFQDYLALLNYFCFPKCINLQSRLYETTIFELQQCAIGVVVILR